MTRRNPLVCGLGQGLSTPLRRRRKKKKTPASYKMLYRALDRFFGMTRPLNTVAQKLGKYMSDSVAAWDVRWAKGASKLIKIITFSVGMEMKILN